jgi:hypothetical protein
MGKLSMKTNSSFILLLVSLSFSLSVFAKEPVVKPIYSEDIIQERIAYDDWHFYKMELEDASKLVVKLRKVSDDADLYVARYVMPSENNFLCAPQKAGKMIETCRLNSHTPGTWYIGVHGAMESDYQISVTIDEVDSLSRR